MKCLSIFQYQLVGRKVLKIGHDYRKKRAKKKNRGVCRA
jgi:hypothetical protein